VIALGVFRARSKECYNAVLTALEAGYRHIDSAAWYGNEADVGRAVSKWMQTSGGKREDVPSPITTEDNIDFLYYETSRSRSWVCKYKSGH
jgi:diketogulonate reductase-like aldo/keto reductase